MRKTTGDKPVPQEVYINDVGDTCLSFCGKENVQGLYTLKVRGEQCEAELDKSEEQTRVAKESLVIARKENKNLRENNGKLRESNQNLYNQTIEVSVKNKTLRDKLKKSKGMNKIWGALGIALGATVTAILCN